WLALVEQAREKLEECVARAGWVLSLRLFRPDPPAELASEGVKALAADIGDELVRGLARTLEEADQGLRFQEVPGLGGGKLDLAADARGVGVFWGGAEGTPPALRAKNAAGRAVTARWEQPEEGRPIYLAQPPFPWIEGEVIVQVGKERK